MKFEIVRIGELKQYVESDEFRNQDIIPITTFRAISQIKNPRANPNNIALVLAFDDENKIVAYAGALPDFLSNVSNKKVAWSSGWWSHPEKGRRASLPVFLKLLELYDKKMLFSHLTPTTKEILAKLNLAQIYTIYGVKAYLKFNLKQQLNARYSWIQRLGFFTTFFDLSLNLFIKPGLSCWKSKLKKLELRYHEIHSVDDQLNQFIKSHNQENVICRAGEEINWIVQNPWILPSNQVDKTISEKYHFSSYSENFLNRLFKVLKDDEILGFFFFQIRDEEVKIPYLYYVKDASKEVFQSILYECLQTSVSSIVTYHKEFTEFLLNNKTPFFYKRKSKRYIGHTNTLDIADMHIQDGDGDVVFT